VSVAQFGVTESDTAPAADDPAGGEQAADDPVVGEQATIIDLDPGYLELLTKLGSGRRVDADHSSLVDAAVAMWSRPGFETILSGSQLAFEPFDYQLQTLQTVLQRMRGRAVLADEVGLGKTIEAGLVLSELRMRGMANRALVVSPAGLVDQWRDELERKFALPTTVARQGRWAESLDHPVVLTSIAAARRDPTRAAVTAAPWDLIIVDEAHRVRNARNASGRLIRALTSRYLLLLTATPVENRLRDLYELISLVAPGLLGTPQQFRQRHTGPKSQPTNTGNGAETMRRGQTSGGPEIPRNTDELRRRTREVMIRHRRSEVEVLLPQRLAETSLVTPTSTETDLYNQVATRIRAEAKDAGPSRRMTLKSLARLAGSSPAALAPTLEKIGWQDLADTAAAIDQPAKVSVLIEQLCRYVERDEKVLVFTAFRQTLDHLAEALTDAGLPAAVYHGSLPRQDKEAAITSFRDEVPILLSTESAGEGRNLQFCHVMINVDLPWNPMQIEQRLGRLHRVGQEHDVTLINLVARNTIEQHIMHVLETKINLFELVVGELDMILGRVEDDFDFEDSVFSAYADSADDDEFTDRLEALGTALADARTSYLGSRDAVDTLVGDEQEA
jgi:SNF2 family DNA or RNA helicase